jgi:hypothetical protein
MRDVFVSHVEEDSAAALQIADALEAAGYSTWCYERDSIPGPSYLVQTGNAVEDCRAVVVLISRHSLGSRQVTVEIVRGHETEKPFIPVLVGITHVDFTNRQPEWREAMGAATSIMVPRHGPAAIVPRIMQGLAALGVEPTGAPSEHATPVSPMSRRRRGPLATLLGLQLWQRILLGLAAVAAVAAVATVVLVVLSPGPETSRTQGAPAAPTTTDTLRTNVGDATVTDVSLADEFCPPAGFPGACEKPTSGKFLIVTLAGRDGGRLTIAVTQQSTGSYITHGDERFNPASNADEYQGVVRVVYAGATDALAGEKVTLVWPDGQEMSLRVSG